VIGVLPEFWLFNVHDNTVAIIKIIQEVLERSNPYTFLTLFNNAVINLNHLDQKVIKGEIQPDRHTESYIVY
jgi:hypothetical protein